MSLQFVQRLYVLLTSVELVLCFISSSLESLIFFSDTKSFLNFHEFGPAIFKTKISSDNKPSWWAYFVFHLRRFDQKKPKDLDLHPAIQRLPPLSAQYKGISPPVSQGTPFSRDVTSLQNQA